MALKPPEAPLHNLPDASTSDQDARELGRLGYAQELQAIADGNDLEARTHDGSGHHGGHCFPERSGRC